MATRSRPGFQTYWKAKFESEFETPFSERLLNLLYFHTDVGIIPRGKLEVTPASNYYDYYNWKKPIQGCYWCSAADISHQAICCSSDCLILFHEWCVHKVNKTTRFAICKFPGCENDKLDKQLTCCEEHCSAYSSKFGIVTSNKGTYIPNWYIDSTSGRQSGQPNPNNPNSMEDDMTDSEQVHTNDVIMTGTDCSSFIFSKRLYEGLIYRTDVGPIPRDSYREEYMSSEFANTANWRRAIEGCYWCGNLTRPHQYTYVCGKKCFSLLHEWCRRKLCEFCGDSLCMLPGCEQVAVESANCCSETHQQQLEKKYKTIKKGKDINLGTGAYWYDSKEILTNKKITQSSFNGHNSFKQMRSTDSDRISDDDNISPNHTSGRVNSSTDSTLGVFFKPTNRTHSSPQDAERGDKPPPYNPCYFTPTDVSGGEAAKPRDQTDHPESMET